MKTYNFHWEVSDLLTLFGNALNDIIIRRYDNNSKTAYTDQIHVNFRYGPKTRTLSDLVNKNAHIQLPVISYFQTGVKRDPSRVFNNIQGSYYNISPTLSGYEHLRQPLPVDIGIGVSIIARFQQDIDQILDNFLVWFDPYIVVSYEIPYFPHEVRASIFWNENVSFEYPLDIAAEAPYRIIANTNFEIKGWLYKPEPPPTSKIYRIVTTFISVSDIYQDYYTNLAMTTSANSEVFMISARPHVTKVIPYLTIPNQIHEFTVLGDMFQFTSGVYIIPSYGVYPDNMISFCNPLSGNHKLSASYPGFSGISIANWTIENEKAITFIMPSAIGYGVADILIQNEAGYGKISQDAKRNPPNPYPPQLVDEYNNWTAYQVPWASGIQIIQSS